MTSEDQTINYTKNVVDATKVKIYIGDIIVSPDGSTIPVGSVSTEITVPSTGLTCFKADGKKDHYKVKEGCIFDPREEVTMSGPDEDNIITVNGDTATGKYKLHKHKDSDDGKDS
ncbi:hypothetical protein PVAG01_11022 [Phlyctema vagabunda]|uniref:Uncharacterized protein n=1 Tax=Phlyctema vagabunda TaxID=108571 RepID=A0ABR4P498_9HELO